MWVFNFDDGMAAESWYAWLAFRRRVSMSAIGSVIVMSGGASLAAVPHALGPRRLGAWACRRSVGLWVVQGGCVTSWTCGRRGAPLRAPSRAGRSGTGRTCGRPSADDCTAGNGCIRGRRTWACGSPSRSEPSWPLFSPTGSADGGHDGLTGEGEAQLAEQLATLVVVRGGGDQRDVHAANDDEGRE